jgi:NADH dehydrogenase
MRARIYLPARTAMSSGTARTRRWVLELAPVFSRELDPLMGWSGSGDTRQQVKLTFATRDQAEAYARERGIDYIVTEPQKRRPNIRPGGYGENFATSRRDTWTH